MTAPFWDDHSIRGQKPNHPDHTGTVDWGKIGDMYDTSERIVADPDVTSVKKVKPTVRMTGRPRKLSQEI